MSHIKPLRLGTAMMAAAIAVSTVGCGVNSTSVATPSASLGIHGTAYGGRQPLTGSAITVWAAGSAGYGSAATSLATTSTGATGNFSIAPGTYTCPTLSTPLYITAQGGNPGNTPNANNPSGSNPDVLLVAALGHLRHGGGKCQRQHRRGDDGRHGLCAFRLYQPPRTSAPARALGSPTESAHPIARRRRSPATTTI